MQYISAFLSSHYTLCGLLALAIINTMPAEPPASLRELPRWAYGWLHDALKTFTSKQGYRAKE